MAESLEHGGTDSLAAACRERYSQAFVAFLKV